MDQDFPHGFVLSEAAIYAFQCQEVFPDILSFAVAIPDHLKPLFLIPIKMERVAASRLARIATRIASCRCADGVTPTGDTAEADYFGTKTFVYDDNEPTVPSSEPGSIFEVDDADDQTHHQEYNYDENIQDPTDTSYMSDVDMTQYYDYPYRTKEKPVRHSSVNPIVLVRLALKPDSIIPRVPTKIKTNANACSVQLVSYDKKTRVFTFKVNCGNGAKVVRAALSEIDHVAMSCTCPFWRWNGPEFHADENKFLLGDPAGTAGPPDVRDPDRKYWLCKHAYAVLKRLDGFVQQVTDENWGLEGEELLDVVDQEWDRLEGAAEVPLDDTEDSEADVDVDWENEPDENEDASEDSETSEDEDASEDSETPEESKNLDDSEDQVEEPEEEPEEEEPEEDSDSEEEEESQGKPKK